MRKIHNARGHTSSVPEGGIVDLGEVDRVARAARLRLSEEERSMYAKDLEDILAAFSVLDQAPSAENYDFNPVPIHDVLREDVPSAGIPPEELTAHMDTYQGYVRGPRLS
jgi:aspartyl-tRNA(Asn)/glutamyl-tRNA(Gln) amidotransferase subunit C